MPAPTSLSRLTMSACSMRGSRCRCAIASPCLRLIMGIAQQWWVRPFLRLTPAVPLDPLKPMALRTLIEAVRAGNALIIFPEGRITVTGSLMKVYDGAAMVADKSNAEIVPVRIEGLEADPVQPASKSQVRRRWFPKGEGHYP